MTEWLVFDTQHSAYASALALTSTLSLSNKSNSLISVVSCGLNRSLVKSHINSSDRSGTIIEVEGSGGVLVMAISGDRLTIGRAVGFKTGINQAYTGPIPPMYWVRPWEGDTVSARGSGTGYFFGDSFNGPEQTSLIVSGARYYYEGYFQARLASAGDAAVNTHSIPQPKGFDVNHKTEIRGDWKSGAKFMGGHHQLLDGWTVTAGVEWTLLRRNTNKWYWYHSSDVNNLGTLMVPVSGFSAVANTPNSYSTTPADQFATATFASPVTVVANVDVSSASAAVANRDAGYSLANSAASKRNLMWVSLTAQQFGAAFQPGASASATTPVDWDVIGGEYGYSDAQQIFGMWNSVSAVNFQGVRMHNAQNAIYTITQNSARSRLHGNNVIVEDCSIANIGGVFSAASSVNIGTVDNDGHGVGIQDTTNVTISGNTMSACGFFIDLYSRAPGTGLVSGASNSAQFSTDNFVIKDNVLRKSNQQGSQQLGIGLDGDAASMGPRSGEISGNQISEIRVLGDGTGGGAGLYIQAMSTETSASAEFVALSAKPYVVSGNIVTSCDNGITTGANKTVSASDGTHLAAAYYRYNNNQVRHIAQTYSEIRSGAAGNTDRGIKISAHSNQFTLFTTQGSAYASAMKWSGTWRTWDVWKALSVSGNSFDTSASTLIVSDTL